MRHSSPLIVSCKPEFQHAYSHQHESLVFCDDFDDLDLQVWNHEITLGGGGNWEFEWYTNNRSNSFVENGVLAIKPTLTADYIGADNLDNGYVLEVWGNTPAGQCTGNQFYGCSRTAGSGGNILNPIQSAALRTSSSFSFKYGRLEIRAKLPLGDWIWPAMWLLPRWESYGGWPASGEIDLMESRGNGASYPAAGVNSFASTLHFGPNWDADGWSTSHSQYTTPTGTTLHDDFHVYGLYWDATQLYTYIDQPTNRVLEVRFNESLWKLGGFDQTGRDNPWRFRNFAAPFDREFYVIFNVAVGGTHSYWPDGLGGKPWNDWDPHAVNAFYQAINTWLATWGNGTQSALMVDWIRVYQ